MTVKESTASAFVFHHEAGSGWRVALVWHPRLAEWMPAGGHVECDETAAEAVVREIGEETGLTVRLVSGPSVPLPAGFPHAGVPAPWWIVEMSACSDNHTREAHIHVDHVFLAMAAGRTPSTAAAHQVRWFSGDEIVQAPDIAEDSRLQAKELFAAVAHGR